MKKNNINELKIKIDELKNEIKDISTNSNKIIDNFQFYYNFINNIITNTSEKKNKNSKLLMNLHNFFDYNEKLKIDIDKIINEKKIENKLKLINEIYEKMIINNEITLKYKIGNEDKIKILGEQFIRNNKDKFQILINNKIIELT